MIRSTLKTITKPGKSLEVYAEQFTTLAQELGDKAFKQIQTPLLDELRFYPPPRPNQKYVRTYKLRRGWKAGIQRLSGDTYALVISNDVNYTAFVVGSLAQAESAAARFQAKVHQGRWELATKTVKFWQTAYLEVLNELFEDELKQFGTITNRTRAFTGKTR